MRVIEDVEFDIDTAQTREDKEAAVQAKASKTWLMLRLSTKSKFAAFDKIEDGKNLKSLFETTQSTEATAQPTNSTLQDTTTKISQEGESNGLSQDHEMDTETEGGASAQADEKAAGVNDAVSAEADVLGS